MVFTHLRKSICCGVKYTRGSDSGKYPVMSWRTHVWFGCCAFIIMSSLHVDSTIRKHPVEFKAIMREVGKSIFEWNSGSYHKMIFAFSDEEVEYQRLAVKLMGFEEIIEPFISTKSSNLIRMAALNLATPQQEAWAREKHEDAENYMDDDDEYLEDEENF